MPLTPAEIHNMEFRKASLGRRGYDDEQVDAFLDETTREMIRLLEDNDRLQRHLDAADATAGGSVADGGAELELSAVTGGLDQARRGYEEAARAARRAQQQLDEARRHAAAEAAPAGAGPGSQQVLTMAERTADDHLHQADEESESLVADARERAGRLLEEAHTRVGEIEQNVRRHQSEAAAELATQRTAARQEIDELTQFIERYRVALGGHLIRQGQLLDGSAARSGEQNSS